MTQHNDDNIKDKKPQMIRGFYVVLSIVAVIIMIVAAFITHGYQVREIKISFGNVFDDYKKDLKNNQENNMNVTPDISAVPSDDVIEDILNDVISNVCDDITDDENIQKKCDKKPLNCLKEYEINKIFIKNSGYEDQLYIELLTGKTQQDKYIVVIDLNTYEVISADGTIDNKRCRDVKIEHEGGDDDLLLREGQDPKDSDYVGSKPKE